MDLDYTVEFEKISKNTNQYMILSRNQENTKKISYPGLLQGPQKGKNCSIQKVRKSRNNSKMSAKDISGKRPNQKSYSPDKDDVYEQGNL